MSQTNYTPISLYYSATASASPSSANLVNGELAINITDGKLFYKDNAGAVQTLATKATTAGTFGAISVTSETNSGTLTLSAGTANGVAYLNGSKVLTTGSALTFDGSLLKLGTSALSVQGVAFPASGVGAELFYDGSESILQSYNRTSSAYAPLWLESSYTRFGIGGSEQMRLTSTGLGLGVTPAYKLDVAGTVNVVNGSNGRINIGATNNYLYGDSSGNVIIGTSGSDKLQVTSAGNLGLGVTPSAWGTVYKSFETAAGSLSGQSTATLTLAQNAYNNGTSWIYKNTAPASMHQQNGGINYWFVAPSGTAGNAITFTQAMTLTSAGYLLVNQTSQGLQNAYGTSIGDQATGAMVINHSTAATTGWKYIDFGYGGGSIGSIAQSGTTAVLYNVTSDQRLKENIADAPEFGSVIDSLQVRSYDWKADQTHQRAGFIAQELVTVAPEAVHQPENPEEMMAVDYSKLVPMLVKEIQSLRKRLTALETK